MLGSYLHPDSGDEILISADSRGYIWIGNEERLTFDFDEEGFKLIPAEGSDHKVEITFEQEEGIVSAAIREDVRYERLVGSMELKVREGPVHLSLAEVKREGENVHAFICNVVQDPNDWRDFSVLAAIATSAHLNNGKPAVIVDDTSPADDDAIQDLLDRLQPNQVTVFRCEDEDSQGQIKGSESAQVAERTCNSLSQMNEYVADTWKGEIKTACVVSNADYGQALLATSLACLLDAPLFVTDGPVADANLEELLPDFGSYPLIVVGDKLEGSKAEVVAIAGFSEALAHAKKAGMTVNYIALTNPADRNTRKLSLTAPVYAAAHGGMVLPVKDVGIGKPGALDGEPLSKVKDQLGAAYSALGQHPRFLNLVGSPEAVPACKTTHDVNNCKDFAVTDYQYATVKFNLDDAHEIAVSRCFTESATAGFLLATRSVNFSILHGEWKDKFVDAGLWGFPELRKMFLNVGYSLASCQEDESKPLHQVDFEKKNKSIEAAAILHKDHSGWSGLGQCIHRHTNAMFAPCVMISGGCHAAGIDEGVPSCASRVMARGGVCFTGAARCPTAIATLWGVAFYNELLYENGGRTLGEANMQAHNKFLAHHLKGVFLGKYTLVNRFTLGDPALRPFPQKTPKISPAKTSFEGDTVTVTAPSEWTMVPVHPDQTKEWKFEGSLYVPVGPGCSPEAQWCRAKYDMQKAYYQLVIKVPGNAKGVELKSLTYEKNGEEVTAKAAVEPDLDPVCGQYECSLYVDKGNANDWHYVTVTKDEGSGNYKWTNKAGVSWTLDAQTLDIKEDCPYHKDGAHNEPRRNAKGIVKTMRFNGEAYFRNGLWSDDAADLSTATNMWWHGEPEGIKELSDGNKLLFVPMKMIDYDQKEGKLQSFVKSFTMQVVLEDGEADLKAMNKPPEPAQRGGGALFASTRKMREFKSLLEDAEKLLEYDSTDKEAAEWKALALEGLGKSKR
ncbi:unnamed protein product [Effrenium voratum]|uniref:Gingipain domain-containing protein n=1 Tax=Effrenium voratum TaxID=2562239 RepID=A0AA36IXB0_9DINO|nr:unnamed protein product [Effrenium voratum]